VLLLEEVGEAPYRVDRLLVQLEEHGVFDRVSGVVSGYFTPVPGAGERTLSVLVDCARRTRVPWLHGLHCGHERPNGAIELGGIATLSECTLRLS
jgi:muramoyltetrapeptide carboxypeptidase